VPRRKQGSADGREAAGAPQAEAKADGEPQARQGVYMISVAAELAGMHPQTLRIYESRGLITPKRSPKNTRLYSQEDVDRLRRIQGLTTEMGMNLAGVEKVFELEEEIERLRRRMRNFQRHAERLRREFEDELQRVRRSFKRELVPYEPPEKALLPAKHSGSAVRVPISRPGRG
jgi:MerR family transcriptional regulator, heat shock protein HspR